MMAKVELNNPLQSPRDGAVMGFEFSNPGTEAL